MTPMAPLPEALPLDLAGACDCHVHINDPRFAYAAGAELQPPPATVADYRTLQQRLGLRRVVVVQPSSYGTDNRCTLDAVAQFGDAARAVVVVDERFGADALARLHAAGARGVRFNLLRPSPVAADAIAAIAGRIAPLGWHLQLHASADAIAALQETLATLPVPLVFDHMGRVPTTQADHPAFGVIARCLDAGSAWVKLSGAELDGAADAPDYTPARSLAARLLALAPERLLWGSNWPHPATHQTGEPLPDDAALLHWLLRLAPDAAIRQAILVDNPAALYGFASA